ncbi:MAG: hypothetical protein ACJ788_20465 [Ktedonobacteraceae bacterium]|jgi:hypothetical protein
MRAFTTLYGFANVPRFSLQVVHLLHQLFSSLLFKRLTLALTVAHVEDEGIYTRADQFESLHISPLPQTMGSPGNGLPT